MYKETQCTTTRWNHTRTYTHVRTHTNTHAHTLILLLAKGNIFLTRWAHVFGDMRIWRSCMSAGCDIKIHLIRGVIANEIYVFLLRHPKTNSRPGTNTPTKREKDEGEVISHLYGSGKTLIWLRFSEFKLEMSPIRLLRVP